MSWSAQALDAGKVRVHVTRTGGEKPAIVLLHGYTDDGPCWSRVARALEAQYDVVMLDARGHGRSDAPSDGYTYEDQAGDVIAAVGALGLGSIALVGHSMGAAVATQVAATAPELVGRLALEDPPPCGGPPRTRAAAEEQAERARLEAMRSKSREQLAAECRRDQPGWHPDEIEPWADSKRRLNPNIARAFVALAAPWWPPIERVTCPVLLLTGEPARGALITDDGARALAGLWQEGRVVRLAGAGHSVHRDRFEPYMAELVPFLAGATGG